MAEYMILTEKKSAADNFAQALGGMSGSFDGHSYQIVHAQGHLMELAEPKDQVSDDLIMPSRKSRDFSHGMDRLTQRPLGHFFFWSALYF